MADNGRVSDIPRRTVSRTARLAGLPIGAAGRATMGLGKRLSGQPADEVMIATHAYDPAARVRSYELVAEAFGLPGDGA